MRGRKNAGEKLSHLQREMTAAMERGCGVYREQDSMRATVDTIAQLKGRIIDLRLEDESRVFNTELVAALELANMIDVAETVANSALARKESRGAHTCRDHKTRNDQDYLYHTLCYRAAAGPRLGRKEVVLGHWEPEERKY